MNVKIGTENTQFPEKEYIKGIFLEVGAISWLFNSLSSNDDIQTSLRFNIKIAYTSACF